jgi:penicillin-binding protein 1A
MSDLRDGPTAPASGAETGSEARGRGLRKGLRHAARYLALPIRNIKWPTGPRGWALWLGTGLAGTLGLFVGAFFLALAIYKPDLPLDSDLYALNRPAAFVFKDAKGHTLGRRGAATGERVRLRDLPAYLPAAFLAMEDRRFCDHGGIDYRGFLRALYANVLAGRIVQGGSTITQQLAKTLFLSPERTVGRKLEEMAAARELESRFDKREILELYLNRIYLGSGAYGVDGASRAYFGKSAKRVTLAEAAMLASLTRAPSVFSPRRDLARAQARARRVLDAMVETGVITPAQAAVARAHPAVVIDRTRNVARNYFFDAAAEEAQRLVPPGSGDLVIVSTIDTKLQDSANDAVEHALDRSARRAEVGQAAVVVMSLDGAVRAVVGGRDYAESAFNRATQARRQAGSAFKPIVYLAAFEAGLEPSTIRTDKPIQIADYKPENYGHSYSGPITLRRALIRSVNTVAVQLLTEVSAERVIAAARRLGIESPLRNEPSLALGSSEVSPLELTGAYGAFATGGLLARPYMVVEVRSVDGRLLYRRESEPQPRIIDEEKALWMNAMLHGVVEWGTGTGARVPGHEVAGKTGTTSEFRDAWFVGFSAEYVACVWVGNDDFTPMREVTGGRLPAQIWSRVMRAALNGHRPRPIPRKEEIAPFDMTFAVTADIAPPGLNEPSPVGNVVASPVQVSAPAPDVEGALAGGGTEEDSPAAEVERETAPQGGGADSATANGSAAAPQEDEMTPVAEPGIQ